MKKAFKIIGGLFGGLFLIVVIALVVDISNDEPKVVVKEESTQPEGKNEVNTEDKQTWEDKMKEVAAKNATETEKFDEISSFAREYKPTDEEIEQFQEDVIKEYKENRYIMDLSNHEYTLRNIFKSDVILRYYKNDPKNPMAKYAMNFWQNSKYNYRGVENMTSESTLINEKQMDKALEEMGK